MPKESQKHAEGASRSDVLNSERSRRHLTDV